MFGQTRSMFGGMSTAPTFQEGQWFHEDGGDYIVKISRVVGPQRSQKNGKTNYLVEFEVIASTNPNDPEGSTRTWFLSMQDDKIWMPNLKQFLGAVCDLDPAYYDQYLNPIVEILAEVAFHESNPLKDLVVHLKTKSHTTKGNTQFTKHLFSAPGANDGRYEAIRALVAAPPAASAPRTAAPMGPPPVAPRGPAPFVPGQGFAPGAPPAAPPAQGWAPPPPPAPVAPPPMPPVAPPPPPAAPQAYVDPATGKQYAIVNGQAVWL